MLRKLTILFILSTVVFAVTAMFTRSTQPAVGGTDYAYLDHVASMVAGHNVTVDCVDSDLEWVSLEGQHGVTVDTDGFTNIGTPVVYIGPRACDALEALDAGYDVGVVYASIAIKTLIHESVHQRGISDEAITDCTALGLVKQYAVQFFGYAATVPLTTYKRVVKVVRKVRFSTLVAVTTTVPNPALAALQDWAQRWHNSLPAQYHGSCG
jgi:hypothetical protein